MRSIVFAATCWVKSQRMLVVATTFGSFLFDAALIVVGFIVWLAELHPTSAAAIAKTPTFRSLHGLTVKLSSIINPGTVHDNDNHYYLYGSC